MSSPAGGPLLTSLPQRSRNPPLLLKYGLQGWVSVTPSGTGSQETETKRFEYLAVNGDVLLQGVLIAQTATYIGHGYHRTDPRPLRLWVAVLLLSTLGQTVYALVCTQLQIEDFPALFQSTKSFDDYLDDFHASEILGVLLVYYVQLFFCWRTWTLSRRLWIPFGLAFILTTAFVCGVVSILDGWGTRVPWAAAYLTLLFAGDGLLSGATMYLLLTIAKDVSRDTASILERLSRVTIQSALPGAVCTLINLIASQTSPSWSGAGGPQDPAAAATIVSNELLPKLYAFSAMWILNSRKSLRKELHRDLEGSGNGHPLSIDVATSDSLDRGGAEGSRSHSTVHFAAGPGDASLTYTVPMKDDDEHEEEEEEHTHRRYRSKRVDLEQALRTRLELEGRT
ncbi:unnamed protein product [Mycena citricolor]|uniref:DUF6534 domain-containing protein n=1 Tax=Mycena citricolor TaxID=2018698 RepID=A0AAD2H712_9AGAR|nr:unnamed protein product [Mycena citricolor]